MPNGYTEEEVSSYVESLLSEKAKVGVTKTGRRAVGAAWETLFANLTNALMLEPSAYFYLVFLASNRTRALAQKQLDNVDALIAAASAPGRRVSALEDADVAGLVNAEAALLNIDAALDENTTGVRGTLGPQIQRFQDSVNSFLAGKLSPRVVRGGVMLPTRDEQAESVALYWSDAAAQDAELTVLVNRLLEALGQFDSLGLSRKAVGRLVGRVRTRVNALQTSLVGAAGVAKQRPGMVELLTSSDLVRRVSNFQPPAQTISPLYNEPGTATILTGENEPATATSTELGMLELSSPSSLDIELDGVPYSVPLRSAGAELLLDMDGWTSGTIYGGSDLTFTLRVQHHTPGPVLETKAIAGATVWADLDDLVDNGLNAGGGWANITAEVQGVNILLRTGRGMLGYYTVGGAAEEWRAAHAFGGSALGLSLADMELPIVAQLPSAAQSGDDAISIAKALTALGVTASAEVNTQFQGTGVFAIGEEGRVILSSESGLSANGPIGSTVYFNEDIPTDGGLVGQFLHFASGVSVAYEITAVLDSRSVQVTPALTSALSGPWGIGPDASAYVGEAFFLGAPNTPQGDVVEGVRLTFSHVAGAVVLVTGGVIHNEGVWPTVTIESRVLSISHDHTSATSSFEIISGVDAGFTNGVVAPEAGRATLSEDVGGRGVEAGDILRMVGGAVDHTATIVSVEGNVVSFTPDLEDPGITLTYTLKSAQHTKFLELRDAISWTGEEFSTADAAAQRLISGAQYASTVQADIESYKAALEALIAALDTYIVRKYPSIQRLIRMFQEQGFNRALDLMTTLRIQELLGASAEDMSYRTHLTRKLADTTRQVAPVHKFAKGEHGGTELGRGSLFENSYENPRERVTRRSR